MNNPSIFIDRMIKILSVSANQSITGSIPEDRSLEQLVTFCLDLDNIDEVNPHVLDAVYSDNESLQNDILSRAALDEIKRIKSTVYPNDLPGEPKLRLRMVAWIETLRKQEEAAAIIVLTGMLDENGGGAAA